MEREEAECDERDFDASFNSPKKKGELHNSPLCFHPYPLHRVEINLMWVFKSANRERCEGEVSARNLGGNGDL